MSARKRRLAVQRRTDYLHRCVERWWRASEIRSEWLRHALSTQPADRERAETAITSLYRLAGAGRPRFVWVESPHAASEVLPPKGPLDPREMTTRWESRLATLAHELRESLEPGGPEPRRWGPFRPPTSATPTALEALEEGWSFDAVIERWVRGCLRRSFVDALCLPVQRALADRLPGFGWYGQHEAHWVAYHDVRRRLGLGQYPAGGVEQLELWATIVRSCGWWWPRERVCVVLERPEAVHTEPVQGGDGDLRLHNPRGPALRYRDGWGMHSWHGTRVPQWAITDPSVERIHAEPNVEVRRCAIERIGWDTYIDHAGLKLVAAAPDPGNGGNQLLLYDIPAGVWGQQARVLLATNGSVERDGRRRRYGLSVPARFDDPVAAAGWSYGLSADHMDRFFGVPRTGRRKMRMKETTLADIKREAGLEVLDHLEVEVAIPVLDGVQAQGDLVVVPLALVDDEVSVVAWARWRSVPPAGIELLRGAAGGNPHTLVTEPGGGRWTVEVRDLTGLALGVLHCTTTAFLIHPEHGGSGIAPGRYVVRRQREQGGWRGDHVRLIAD